MVHVACTTVPPWPALVAHRAPGALLVQPCLYQVACSGIAPLPLAPENAAEFSSDPAVQLVQHTFYLRQPEVTYPAAKDGGEFVDRPFQITPVGSLEHLPDFGDQPLSAGRSDPKLGLLVPRHAVAQELPIPRSRHCALCFVYL